MTVWALIAIGLRLVRESDVGEPEMMEFSYLYLAVPPDAAVVAAIIGGRIVRRSTARIDRMQRQFDREEAVRSQVRNPIPLPEDVKPSAPFETRTPNGASSTTPVFTPKGSVQG